MSNESSSSLQCHTRKIAENAYRDVILSKNIRISDMLIVYFMSYRNLPMKKQLTEKINVWNSRYYKSETGTD